MAASDHLNDTQFYKGEADPRTLKPTQRRRTNPDVVSRLSSDMAARGYQGPALDTAYGFPDIGGSRIGVLDGHHRRASAIQAGLSSVPVFGLSGAGIPEGMQEIDKAEYNRLSRANLGI